MNKILKAIIGVPLAGMIGIYMGRINMRFLAMPIGVIIGFWIMRNEQWEKLKLLVINLKNPELMKK